MVHPITLGALLAGLAAAVAGCAGAVAPTRPAMAAGGIPSSIQVQTYIPGGPGLTASPGQVPYAQPPATVTPARRRGSSSPPPPPMAFPPPVPMPPAPDTSRAVDAFRRDQLRGELDRLRNDDASGRLDAMQQRDLLMKQMQLDRMTIDATRR